MVANSFKVINFAAGNKSWRLVCNPTDVQSCKVRPVCFIGHFSPQMHCNRQFTDTLSINECSKAVTDAYAADGYSCFPMNSTVSRKGDGLVTLDRINIGDEVLVASDEGTVQYDPVIGFLHWENETKHLFLRIQHNDGTLTIHKDHFIPCSSPPDAPVDFMRSNDLNVGDSVRTLWIDGTVKSSTITSISEIEEVGLICPITMSGRIIVDSVDCSCYSPPSGFLPWNISHAACHFVMAPVRLNYQWNKDKLIKSKQPDVPEPGLHPYARILMTAVTGVLFS